MRRETEMLFEHIVRERSEPAGAARQRLHLPQRAAGEALRDRGRQGRRDAPGRRCPPGSPRGGVLTQGTVLAVTSNPDRTSPVKRGLFILDNILGSPPAPPPPNIPPLEEAGKKVAGRTPTLRESLALHRSDAVVRLLPQPDGPARAGPRELQRARALARQGAGRAHRRLREADHRRVVPGRSRS